MKFNQHWTENHVVKAMYHLANSGTWDGGEQTEYFYSCAHYWEKYEATMFFTRDTGHHTSGWWKNPDYERCYHLSISFVDKFGNSKPHNSKKAAKLIKLIYGNNQKLLWCEPPYSEYGVEKEVWHYRLFADEAWKPMKPTGEVYSKYKTPAHWKSYSDVQNLRGKL